MRRPGLIDYLAYSVSQTARVGWFYSQYRAAQSLAPRLPARRWPKPGTGAPGLGRSLMADLRALMRRDWENIRAGLYKPPHDLVPSPRAALRQALRFFADLPAVNLRRRERLHSEVHADAPAGRYPRYYLQNFHYQTDGYLSERSAALYDYQVEVLFLGGADAMRRQALPALRAGLADRPDARLLDVACGTGRFLSFVKDNFPGLRVTGLDLSPAYLDQAARTLRRWDGIELVHANAEAMPLADASVDAVTCVYLFHELPRAVRAQVTAEIARVLKPGGTFVLVDSLQRGDRPLYDPLLERFPVSFHEPYYADYIGLDLRALLADSGLTVDVIELAFLSKVVVATRAV
ncbi:MAG: class I SAM-dependent methyltransferase [Proteobacteria bacterium]|nr:class I SAM-dependent methyltransferase [Pseudomonadota bacterium]